MFPAKIAFLVGGSGTGVALGNVRAGDTAACGHGCFEFLVFFVNRVFSRDVIKFLNSKLKSHQCFCPH